MKAVPSTVTSDTEFNQFRAELWDSLGASIPGEWETFGVMAKELEIPCVPGSPVQRDRERLILQQETLRGTTNVNLLANAVFFDRYPERNGRLISKQWDGSNFPTLSREWICIRDTQVLPFLHGATPGQPAFVTADLKRSLGGGTVRLSYFSEDPKNAEAFPFAELSYIFTGTLGITRAPYAQPGTWVRYDVNIPALAYLDQGTAAVIQPAHWTFWIRFSSRGWEVQADPVTRSMIRVVTIATKRGVATQERVLTGIRNVLSKYTAGCRARYFYKVMSDNDLSPTIMGNYGNWCGKGGAGIALDSFDQCCKEHDDCYGREECSIFDKFCRKECDDCDNTAAACWLAAVAREPARYGTRGSIRYPCHKCGASIVTPEGQQRCRQEC